MPTYCHILIINKLGNCNKSLFETVQCLHTQATYLIINTSEFQSIWSMERQPLMTVDEHIKFWKTVPAYRAKNDTASKYMKGIFLHVQGVHDVNLRLAIVIAIFASLIQKQNM